MERSPEAFVEAGEKIFFGKGKCSSCHSIGPGVKSRCPDILKASREAGTRKSSLTARQYLIESVYKPSAYVVKGYTAIMPEVWKPPIGLTPVEIEMVIAYIQSLSGGDVDVSPIIAPVDLGKASFVQSGKALTVTGNLRKGKRVFESGKGKCLACHKVFGKGGEGEEGSIGPD
ncbi:MAG: c-type cytochrome, partial [Nitrospinota bacterium]